MIICTHQIVLVPMVSVKEGYRSCQLYLELRVGLLNSRPHSADACCWHPLLLPQDDDVVRPMHNVVCSYTPQVPGAIGSVINARGDIRCGPTPPDVSSTALRIWRYNGGSSYTMMAERVSNRLATSWSIDAGGTCNTGRSHLFHTEIVNSSFHGTWDETINNSRAVRLTC